VLSKRLLTTFLVFASGLVAEAGHAEFLRVGGAAYQTPSVKVLAVDSGGMRGIFILSGAPTAVQLFDLPAHPKAGSASVFLRFDPTTNSFPEIITPLKTFKVKGSFAMTMGKNTRLVVDTASNTTPYISIVDSSLDAPALLGIVGTTVAVNASGSRAVDLLEAQIVGVGSSIETYKLGENGSISVGNSPLTSDRVGVVTEVTNRCREANAVILDPKASLRLQQILKEDSPANASQLLQLVKGNAAESPLADLILLRVSKDTIVGFAYANGQFVVVKNVELPGSDSNSPALCTMSVVRVDG